MNDEMRVSDAIINTILNLGGTIDFRVDIVAKAILAELRRRPEDWHQRSKIYPGEWLEQLK